LTHKWCWCDVNSTIISETRNDLQFGPSLYWKKIHAFSSVLHMDWDKFIRFFLSRNRFYEYLCWEKFITVQSYAASLHWSCTFLFDHASGHVRYMWFRYVSYNSSASMLQRRSTQSNEHFSARTIWNRLIDIFVAKFISHIQIYYLKVDI
jgi:hypothetical protein